MQSSSHQTNRNMLPNDGHLTIVGNSIAVITLTLRGEYKYITDI